MTARPVLIAQISDLHIKPPGMLAYRRVDTAAALRHCIAALERLEPRPDIVVVTGDLADCATPEGYAHLRQLLGSLTLPLALVPGNHDARARLAAAFPDQRWDRSCAAGSGALNMVQRIGPVDVLLADSSVPGEAHGELDADTLRWLEAALGATSERPALLFLHHPPFVTGIRHMDRQNLRNAAALASLVGRHRRVRLIAAGHVHRAVLTVFAGAAATICPAPNHAVALDLGEASPAVFRIEPPGFHLHVCLPQTGFGEVVTHFVPIETADGPYPFHGPDGKLL